MPRSRCETSQPARQKIGKIGREMVLLAKNETSTKKPAKRIKPRFNSWTLVVLISNDPWSEELYHGEMELNQGLIPPSG